MKSIYLSKVVTKPTDRVRQLVVKLDPSQRYDLGTLTLYTSDKVCRSHGDISPPPQASFVGI